MTVKQLVISGPFMIPYLCMMVFYGTTLSSITDAISGNYNAGPLGLILMIAGSVIALVSFILLTMVVKKHLNSMINGTAKAQSYT